MLTDPLVAPAAQSTLTHRQWREGARAGLLATAAGALWSLIVDLAAGHPFRTWDFLGDSLLSVLGPSGARSPVVASIVFLTIVALVFVLLGRVAVGAAHRADVQPSLIIFASTILTLLTLALVAYAMAFTTSRLGAESWLQILGSSLIALWTLAIRVYRTHPSLALDIRRLDDA